MAAPNRYRRDRTDRIASCVLDDMVLLYHHRSGQTHMVISPVPEILEALADGAPGTARDVHDRLARLYDVGRPDDALAQITAHLDRLAALGLVRVS